MAVKVKEKNMEDNFEIKNAQTDSRANDLLSYLSKWNMTVEETVDVLYRAQDMIRQKREKVLLMELLRKLK